MRTNDWATRVHRRRAKVRQDKLAEQQAQALANRLGWRLPDKALRRRPDANRITVGLTAGMPDWLKERLRARARRDQVSMAEWCRQVVWEALKRPEKPGT